MYNLETKSLLPFTEEHEKWRAEFGKFLDDEIVPHYLEWEKACGVPHEVFEKFGAHGYGCLWLDKKYGGQEKDLLYTIIYGEELSKRGLNGVLTRLSSDTVAPYIYHHGTEAQKEFYLPKVAAGEICISVCMTEQAHGSDLANIETTAVLEGDHYVINGGKTYISNGLVSDYAIVACRTNPNAEKPYKGISLIIVPTNAPGFERRLLNKIGLRSQDTAEYTFNNVVVPKENLLGEENGGFYILMQHLEKERLMSAWGTLGMAEHAFELCMQRAQERLVAGKPLGDYQHWQYTLAQCAIELDQARSYVEHLTLLFMNKSQPVNTQVAIAKYATAELAYKISDIGVQIWGGEGIIRDNAIARQYVDTRHYRLMAGTSEVMLGIVAKSLGLGAKKKK